MQKRLHHFRTIAKVATVAFVALLFIFTTQTSAIAAQAMTAAGDYHTVGLKTNGTVVGVGDNWENQINVSSWTDIEQLSAGFYHTVGLKTNGTVVVAGCKDPDYDVGQCDVSSWTGIVWVAGGSDNTFGVKTDGTVVAVGDDWAGQLNVGSWTDIVQVVSGWTQTVGLKTDGTVVAVGNDNEGQLNVGSWTDIEQLSAGYYHTVGLKTDGTVVAAGCENPDFDVGQCDVDSWTDIVQVTAGYDNTLGLKTDGTVVVVGNNTDGQLNVGSWTDIEQIATRTFHTVGVKADGTVVAVGDNSEGQLNVSSWNLGSDSLFTDVPPGHWAEEAIEAIYYAGITQGCSQNPLKFCPDVVTNREQMAVFLGRSVHGSEFTPPDATGIFTDVSLDHWAADWIEQAYDDGITQGCSTNPLKYCPTVNVTRAQMAVFLLRAKHGDSYTPPIASGIFSDVDLNHWAADWIEQLYNEGITVGCGTDPLRFCPDASVTRAQMAVFLMRTFGL